MSGEPNPRQSSATPHPVPAFPAGDMLVIPGELLETKRPPWEYTERDAPLDLNGMGDAGWELVTAYAGSMGTRFIFKREKS